MAIPPNTLILWLGPPLPSMFVEVAAICFQPEKFDLPSDALTGPMRRSMTVASVWSVRFETDRGLDALCHPTN